MRKLAVAVAILLFPWLAAADPVAPAASRSVFVGWIDDDHWLVAREGRLRSVSALSGDEVEFSGFTSTASSLSALEKEALAERAETIIAMQKAGTPLEVHDDRYPTPGPFEIVNQKAMGKEVSTASPDGKWTAICRKNDLYVVEKATKHERRLTQDGSPVIFNGRADAVYQEEIFYPQRSTNAFWWSPDSAHVAFLRLDDTSVPRFTIIDQTQRVQQPEVTTYPKAGAANPTVKIGIASVEGGTLAWVDLSNYQPRDLLIARVGWTPDSKQVYCYAQNRTQTWLDVCVASCATGQTKKLFRDRTRAWIHDNGAIGPINFLKDGSFLFFSERSGNRHLYHYEADGRLKAPVTSGDWDAQKLNKVDETEGWVYFNSNKDTWLGSKAYRVRLDGTELETVTKAGQDGGTHQVHFSPGGKYFVDEWSTFDTPGQMFLCSTDGTPIRAIETVQAAPIQEKKNKAEIVKIKTPDGVTLAATVLFPPNLDAKKKYPVWFSTYGGPHMPTIKDAFAGAAKGGGDLAKAAQGYIVFHADPRSASTTPRLAWTCYKQLGVQELKDVETALTWLIDTYPVVDAKRIGISGHSYGGFLAAYALTHSKMFAAGIAGAPPTDWRNYNSIYVDRYMTTPEENPAGFEAGSVVAAAKNLHGRLLILHGMMDDNVHMTSAIQLVDALQQANLDFEIMLYPHARHGIGGEHYKRIQNDFMKRVLQP
jgi:dipeptidyl-peptidase-4